MSRKSLRSCSLFILFGIVANYELTILAQNSVSGAIVGSVLNETDRTPIPKATIQVENRITGARSSTVSFADGSYRLPMLSSGEYMITCRHPDFQDNAYGPVQVALVKPTTIRYPPS